MPVGAVHCLAASVLDHKQVCKASAPLYRCDGVGDKFTHPRSACFPPRQTRLSHAVAHIQLCSTLLRAIVTFGQPLRGGFRA